MSDIFDDLSGSWNDLYAVSGTQITVGATNIPAVISNTVRNAEEETIDGAVKAIKRSALVVKAADWDAVNGTLSTEFMWGNKKWRVVSEESMAGVSPYVQLEVVRE